MRDTRRYDAIVLSSGGIRGCAHLGALDALHTRAPEALASVRTFVGTSAGACVATMLALGYPPKDAMDAFVVPFTFKKDLRVHKLWTPNFGIEHGEALESFIGSIVARDLTFKMVHDQRNVVLGIVGTNLNRGTSAVFDVHRTPHMTVFEALRVSCSVPLVFAACPIDGELHVDGAISNPFPMNVAMDHYGCTDILGLRFDTCNAPMDPTIKWRLDTYLGAIIDTLIHSQTLVIPTKRGVTTDVCTIATPAEISAIDFELETERKYDLFQAGSDAMVEFLKKLS